MTAGLKMKYFVLKPGGDDVYALASRKAMHAYGKAIMEVNPELAEALARWATDEAYSVYFYDDEKGE